MYVPVRATYSRSSKKVQLELEATVVQVAGHGAVVLALAVPLAVTFNNLKPRRPGALKYVRINLKAPASGPR